MAEAAFYNIALHEVAADNYFCIFSNSSNPGG
jgi:hypothetical protein